MCFLLVQYLQLFIPLSLNKSLSLKLSYFNLGNTAKRHFKLYGDSISLLPLKLSYSRRTSHQISTHVLRILLEEVLGYEDTVLVPDESGLLVNKALEKLTGCRNHRYDIHVCGAKNEQEKYVSEP